MRTVYNVVIAGYSIGLTFEKAEAERWLRESTYPGRDKVIKTYTV